MRPFRTLATASALALLWAAPADAKPRVSWAKCVKRCDGGMVQPGGQIKVAGGGFTRGSKVVFAVNRGGLKAKRAMRVKRRAAKRLIVSVPRNARTGRIYVRAGRLRSKPSRRPVRIAKPRQRDSAPSSPTGTPFDGAGMWVWELKKANGGSAAAMAQQALGNNVSTVFIKSGDGTNYWSQFSPALVADLKARGLRVCAWQYVYGRNPAAEADVAARAKDAGAECFVIDAETEYEGKYRQARTYMSRLRASVGRDFPVGLAGFPYVHYHPSYPYSVFFGDGGAQFNVPQTYWIDIGGGVDPVVDTTYHVNRPYGRPIVPIGQTYGKPEGRQVSAREIQRFRARVAAHGSTGLSWWSWQHTNAAEWAGVAAPVGALPDPQPSRAFVTVKKGDEGDLILWAQQHLSTAGFPTAVDGEFGAKTQQAVRDFQGANNLTVTGEIDTTTWRKLLEQVPEASTGKPKNADAPTRRREIQPAP